MKIISVVLMLITSAFPFLLFICVEDTGDLLLSELLTILMCLLLIRISYQLLLSTNNPADRKNFFSINKRYSSKMNGTIGDNGLKSIPLLEPTYDEIVQVQKNKRLKKLKKLNKVCQT